MTDFDDRSRRPKVGELEVVVAIAAAGSLGGAAADLGCTQSRISHALAQIEARLRLRLFERSRTGSHPTSAGQVVIAQAREALRLIDSLAIIGDPRALHGTVRVAAYRSVATHLLTPLVDALARVHPGIRLDIDDSCAERQEVERAVRERRADLGVAHLPVAAGLVARPFARDDYVIVLAGARKPAHAGVWAQLAKLPLVELRCSGARATVEACRRNGMANRTVATFASESTVLAQIATRRGFAILPRLAVEPLAAGLVLGPLPIARGRSLAIIRRTERRDPLTTAVSTALRAAVKRQSFEARQWLSQ